MNQYFQNLKLNSSIKNIETKITFTHKYEYLNNIFS